MVSPAYCNIFLVSSTYPGPAHYLGERQPPSALVYHVDWVGMSLRAGRAFFPWREDPRNGRIIVRAESSHQHNPLDATASELSIRRMPTQYPPPDLGEFPPNVPSSIDPRLHTFKPIAP